MLWSSGMLTPEKSLRYAAVIYGLDLTEIPYELDKGGANPNEELLTREQILEARVQQSELLQSRVEAIRHSLKRGTPYGSQEWVSQSAVRLQVSHTLRPRGRPRKS